MKDAFLLKEIKLKSSAICIILFLCIYRTQNMQELHLLIDNLTAR